MLLPLLLGLTIFQHGVVVGREERVLESMFGKLFTDYSMSVPAYVPRVVPRPPEDRKSVV